ncbi:MAG: sulfatase-like hydrolase/transferase [Caldilineaceae bacterium]
MPTESAPPNILLILADDHGQWSVGCYGNREVRTPNLDYLAASGTQFTNAFTPCPVCSPARASLFTGRIPSQHGVHDFLSEDVTFSDHRWLAEEILLPQLLQRRNYQTALVGKWHCTIDGHNPQPGFDYWVSYDVRERGWRSQYEHRGKLTSRKQGQRTTVSGFQSQYLTGRSAWLFGSTGSAASFLPDPQPGRYPLPVCRPTRPASWRHTVIPINPIQTSL